MAGKEAKLNIKFKLGLWLGVAHYPPPRRIMLSHSSAHSPSPNQTNKGNKYIIKSIIKISLPSRFFVFSFSKAGKSLSGGFVPRT